MKNIEDKCNNALSLLFWYLSIKLASYAECINDFFTF